MDLQQYQHKLQENTKELLSVLKSINQDHLHVKKAENWSVMEVAEHIFLADKTFISRIEKPTDDVAETEFVMGEDKMNRLLVGMRDKKVKAPGFLEPKGRFDSIQQFEAAFVELRTTFVSKLLNGEIVANNELQLHPRFGKITKADWCYFMIYHTKRHIEQIKELVN